MYGTYPLSLPIGTFTIIMLFNSKNQLADRDTAQILTTVYQKCVVYCPLANSWCLANNCLSYNYRIAEAIVCSDGHSEQRHLYYALFLEIVMS